MEEILRLGTCPLKNDGYIFITGKALSKSDMKAHKNTTIRFTVFTLFTGIALTTTSRKMNKPSI